jgi:hypothetical protein
LVLPLLPRATGSSLRKISSLPSSPMEPCECSFPSLELVDFSRCRVGARTSSCGEVLLDSLVNLVCSCSSNRRVPQSDLVFRCGWLYWPFQAVVPAVCPVLPASSPTAVLPV